MALSARAEPDNTRSLGHARLILAGASAEALAAGYRIRREGYQASNLGLRGWQVSEEILRPVDIRDEGANTVLILGPRMTRNMEPGPVHLVVPGLGEVGLFWPDTIEVFDGELPPDPIIPQEPPERLSTPRAPPSDDATVILRPAAPPISPLPPPPVAPVARKTPVAAYAGGGVLLVLAIAASVWWFLLREPAEEATPAPAPPPALTPTPTPVPAPAPVAPTPAPSPPPLQPQAAIWPDGTDDLSLRDVVGRAADAAAIVAVARRRQAAGRYDDALVLMEEAAARGHAPAMTALGRMYDPSGFVPGQPFRTPDPRAAARHYAEAERGGDAAAAPLRAALRAWLQQQADGGSTTAATTLREFW